MRYVRLDKPPLWPLAVLVLSMAVQLLSIYHPELFTP